MIPCSLCASRYHDTAQHGRVAEQLARITKDARERKKLRGQEPPVTPLMYNTVLSRREFDLLVMVHKHCTGLSFFHCVEMTSFSITIHLQRTFEDKRWIRAHTMDWMTLDAAVGDSWKGPLDAANAELWAEYIEIKAGG